MKIFKNMPIRVILSTQKYIICCSKHLRQSEHWIWLNNTWQGNWIVVNIQEYANQTDIGPKMLGYDLCPPNNTRYAVWATFDRLKIKFCWIIHTLQGNYNCIIIENTPEYADQTNISPPMLRLDLCSPNNTIYAVWATFDSLKIEFCWIILCKVIPTA
jgi:hypothetical protein